MPDFTLICLSHLRWDFVFQRPQHLMSRCSAERPVIFFEEPHFDAESPRLELHRRERGVTLAVPHLPAGIPEELSRRLQQLLLDGLLQQERCSRYTLWYYTPMAMAFTRHLAPQATVYDCMDELSLFASAHPDLLPFERELLERADLVFTGGQSLYEAKRDRHPQVHAFPSSVDVAHFAQARRRQPEPADQGRSSAPAGGLLRRPRRAAGRSAPGEPGGPERVPRFDPEFFRRVNSQPAAIELEARGSRVLPFERRNAGREAAEAVSLTG